MQSSETPTLGWREWLSLPALGIGAIKAKLDTGARTSSLCVVSLETFDRDGRLHVRFAVRPRRRGERLVMGEAPVVDRRPVTDSGGHITERWNSAAMQFKYDNCLRPRPIPQGIEK